MPIKLPSLKGLLTGSITEGVKVIADVVDRFKLTGEEKAAITQAAADAMNAHAEKMEELALKAIELENADRDSARDMNAKVQESEKASWMAKNIAYILDVLVGIVWASLTLYIAAISARLIETKADFTGILSLYSTVVAVFMISLNFHRGTSRGSEKKQELIDRMRR